MPTSGSQHPISLPVYSKLAQIILGILGFFYIMYVGQDILVPLVFSFVFAILLNPAVNYLLSKRFNRVLAISIVLFVTFLLVIAVLYFIGMQFAMFTESMPEFKKHFGKLTDDLIRWVSANFNVPRSGINNWIAKLEKDGLSNGPAMIGQTLGTIGGVLSVVFLLPVYMFTILYYKPLLLKVVSDLFARTKHALVEEVLSETKTLIQSYLAGLMIEMVLVAAMNSIGLMIIGVKYGLLLGVIGAILNLIPYIGGIIAIALPVLMALATGNPSQAIWAVALYLVVQFIDNNIIVTKIVASKVKINALISIVVVLIGGALWGVSGMFLSIPITALVKVVFDRIEPLKPFGLLLGDDNQEDSIKQTFAFRKRKAPAKKS